MYLCWQRFIDVTFGLLGVVLLLLLLPLLALLIYTSSPGPIFYCQERLGFQGKTFRIYKFRSMYQNAEPDGRAVWAAKDDRRVMYIGRVMRAIHLDELPQVLNILRGEMSLIGPRPERAEFVSLLEKTIPLYRSRMVIKPGLTGLAQVKFRYARSEEDTLKKLHYDFYYIKHRSCKLDILIIFKTIVEVALFHGT